MPFDSCGYPRDRVPEGYARRDDNPHLCVDVPDGNSTITVRTSEGKQITFDFLKYSAAGPPQCVDIVHHHDGDHTMNGDLRCPHQDVRVFGLGVNLLNHSTGLKTERPATVTCVIFDGPPNTI